MTLGSDPVSAGGDDGPVRTCMKHLELHASGSDTINRIDMALAVSLRTNAVMVHGSAKYPRRKSYPRTEWSCPRP